MKSSGEYVLGRTPSPWCQPMNGQRFSEAIRAVPVVAVLRGYGAEQAVALGAAAADGGLLAVEVTVDSPGALQAITLLRSQLAPEVAVGAGTVLSVEQVDLAIAAGADFVVSPHLDEAVVGHASSLNVTVVPGVASPTELWNAVQAGVPMVKLFPAGTLGFAYLSALRGPYPDVAIMVSGGIAVEQVKAWLAAGATAVALGLRAFGRTPAAVLEEVRALLTSLDGDHAG